LTVDGVVRGVSLQTAVREHVGATVGVLTLLSLAVVFGVTLGYVPAGAIPRFDPLVALVPHLNAVISLAAIGVIVAGVRLARSGRYVAHRRTMLLALGLFVLFLGLYLYRVALEGPTHFDGSGVLRTLYTVFLAVHVLLAVASLPPVYLAAVIGLSRPIPAVRETIHARVGRLGATLWLISFAMGIGVYLILYVLP
jgi:putative membrane protein